MPRIASRTPLLLSACLSGVLQVACLRSSEPPPSASPPAPSLAPADSDLGGLPTRWQHARTGAEPSAYVTIRLVARGDALWVHEWGRSGRLVSSATGKVVRTLFGPGAPADSSFEPYTHRYLLVDDALVGSTRDCEIVAASLETGRVMWRFSAGDATAGNCRYELRDGLQLVAHESTILAAWSTLLPPPGLRGNAWQWVQKLVVLDRATGKPVREHVLRRLGRNQPASRHDAVVLAGSARGLLALHGDALALLDYRTLKELWRRSLAGSGDGPYEPRLEVRGDAVYATKAMPASEVSSVRLSSGEMIRRFAIEGAFIRDFAVADAVLFAVVSTSRDDARVGAGLVAMSIADGHLLWQRDSTALTPGMAVRGERLYTLDAYGTLTARSSRDGRQLGQLMLAGAHAFEPLAESADGLAVAVADRRGRVFAIDAAAIEAPLQPVTVNGRMATTCCENSRFAVPADPERKVLVLGRTVEVGEDGTFRVDLSANGRVEIAAGAEVPANDVRIRCVGRESRTIAIRPGQRIYRVDFGEIAIRCSGPLD